MSYLWHQVSEEEREEIRKEAKRILDDFSKKLASLKLKDVVLQDKENLGRIEGSGTTPDSGFKERMFANAPNKNKDAILAEKKKW